MVFCNSYKARICLSCLTSIASILLESGGARSSVLDIRCLSEVKNLVLKRRIHCALVGEIRLGSIIGMEHRLHVRLRVYCELTGEVPIGDVTSTSIIGVVGRFGMTMSLCMGVSVDCADQLCIS